MERVHLPVCDPSKPPTFSAATQTSEIITMSFPNAQLDCVNPMFGRRENPKNMQLVTGSFFMIQSFMVSAQPALTMANSRKMERSHLQLFRPAGRLPDNHFPNTNNEHAWH